MTVVPEKGSMCKGGRFAPPAPQLSALRQRLYNVTQEQYEVLWAACCGRCPICDKPFADTPNRRDVLDHDHHTGHIRGLLCAACNHALGIHTDQWFLNANEYLRHTPADRLGIVALHREWTDR